MTKEEILDYVMNTPENTNRMVLSDMLDELQTGGGSGGLVVETEWEAPEYLDNAYFKSTTLGTDLRAAIMSGQHVIVHIPGNESYGAPEVYFTPILQLKDVFGQEEMGYLLPKTGSNYGTLMDGNDDDEGYVQFMVMVD